MSRSDIPTYDLFVDGQEKPTLQGVHKNQANTVIADLKKNGVSYVLTRSKSIKSSKFSKKYKDRIDES